MSNTQLIIALFAIIMAAPAIGEIIRLACLAGHRAVSGHNLHIVTGKQIGRAHV